MLHGNQWIELQPYTLTANESAKKNNETKHNKYSRNALELHNLNGK